MEKRVVIALVLCTGIFVVWQYLFGPKPQPAAQGQGATATQTAPGPAPGAPPPVPAAGQAPAAPAVPAPAAGTAAVNHPEREIEVRTPQVRFVFSSAGATLKHAQ